MGSGPSDFDLVGSPDRAKAMSAQRTSLLLDDDDITPGTTWKAG
jgi:hypothetical protein